MTKEAKAKKLLDVIEKIHPEELERFISESIEDGTSEVDEEDTSLFITELSVITDLTDLLNEKIAEEVKEIELDEKSGDDNFSRRREFERDSI